MQAADQNLRVSIRIGVCTASGTEADVDQLMKGADAALYRAKANARNCLAVETSKNSTLARR
jgi:GGDEF domain-containing protein